MHRLGRALESFVFYAQLRRRRRLGLADPVLTHRFLTVGLWGIGLLSMTALAASTLLASAAGVDPAELGWVLLESSAGMLGAATLWLTYFPNRRHRAFVVRRAERPV